MSIIAQETTASTGGGSKHGAVTAVDAEKRYTPDEVSTDGDDGLKLAGTQAHHFDEEYYKRLRWKIVS